MRYTKESLEWLDKYMPKLEVDTWVEVDMIFMVGDSVRMSPETANELLRQWEELKKASKSKLWKTMYG